MAKRTPFYSVHQESGAKIVDFAGYDMPVQYEGIKSEHHSVREAAGMFDVSHMGEFFVQGPNALNLIQKVSVNDASKLTIGKAQYSCMCYEDGGIVDDLIIYRLGEEEYMLVVNASNIEKDFDWIASQNDMGADLENRSDDYALLAVQGPKAPDTLQKLTDTDLSSIGFYSFKTGKLAGTDMIISATGYTGEKGFELYFNHNEADPEAVWDAIMEAGEEFGIQACGLGARDTLRLEMGYALYGNDITQKTHPLEARLGWITKFDKGDFVGKEALLEKKEQGLKRRLVGFEVEDQRAIPRHGYDILDENDNVIGEVSSGTMSITLGKAIGMGYVDTGHAAEGTEIYIAIRKKRAKAIVSKPPFINK
ncbi:glycine cleavage system aminomethyltransferase GcvT [Balneola sp. MJW-20]|uniref:glycine cleavage system aminomethyltransferase GcvT n=1 Tax=Gracilimonas aurantiaca TaxID=3234185 RepID=UPI0034674942